MYENNVSLYCFLRAKLCPRPIFKGSHHDLLLCGGPQAPGTEGDEPDDILQLGALHLSVFAGPVRLLQTKERGTFVLSDLEVVLDLIQNFSHS